MNRNKLLDLAGLKGKKIEYGYSELIIESLDRLRESVINSHIDNTDLILSLDKISKQFERESLIDKNSEIFILLENLITEVKDKSEQPMVDEIRTLKEKFDLVIKELVKIQEKEIPKINIEKVDLSQINSILNDNFTKLQTPFSGIKEFFVNISNSIKNIYNLLEKIYFLFIEPDKVIMDKIDGKIVKITYYYKNKEIIETIDRDAGKIIFSSHEKNN